MTFSEMLRLLEDFGPISGGSPTSWPQDYINGPEFANRGIRDKHSSQDRQVKPQRTKKSAEEMYYGKSRKSSK
jgi:hypothetical protein